MFSLTCWLFVLVGLCVLEELCPAGVAELLEFTTGAIELLEFTTGVALLDELLSMGLSLLLEEASVALLPSSAIDEELSSLTSAMGLVGL